MSTITYEITQQVCLSTPLGHTLAHAINPSGTVSIATSRNGNMAVFELDRDKVPLMSAPNFGDIWQPAIAASGLTALTIAAPDPIDFPDSSHWFLGLWDIRLRELSDTMDIEPFSYYFAASSDLQTAMVANGRTISWWHPQGHNCLGSVTNPHVKNFWKVAVSADGSWGASTSPDEAYLWDIAAQKSIKKIALPKPKLFGKPPSIRSIRFGTDHLYLGFSDGIVWVADVSGTMLEKIIDTGNKAGVQVFDIHEKSNLAAVVFWGGYLELWDLFSGKLAGAVNTGHEKDVMDVRIKPDASSVVTTGKDGTVRVWSLREK